MNEEFRTLLVPTDLSTASRTAVDRAAGLAAALDADVVLLHVIHVPSGLPAGARIQVDDREHTLESYLVETAQEALDALASSLGDRGLRVSTEMAVGDAADEIVAAIDRTGADLVVMGTHGRRGLRHALLGSVAERVVRRAPVPVLTIRSTEPDVPSEADRRARAELDG